MLNFSSKLGVAKTSSAVLRCRAVRFSLLINLFLDQFVSVSPRFVGPYNGGAGFQVLWSNAKRYVCSLIVFRVGGFGFKTGVDLVLPGWLDGSLISGINDDGGKAVFLGGCKEFVKLICGIQTGVTGVSIDEERFVFFGVVVLLLADCGEVADQSELFGECSGCTLKCSWTKLKSCLC